ncbi:glycerophosphodiester phosphodiesterase [Aquimarina sp. TRL1]|uniref:glycerophosphodiester phosphodiesterase n=1 Tax=Aquimarina sp. (strain TRL1) TaxID=2736252 RepID=UPI00158D8A62|nr:glycerophosphodiester phosphodiesterase family protein [Aquimarina sp. TRL1]QKX04309.1 glycerophosphodiester phosphodiesterase [Aquimarina sp. TRL1]
MKIFGHRGAAGLAEENTLISVEEALRYSVDGVEIDVHRCRSGELIVMHDETIDRTTRGEGRVSELSFQELKNVVTNKGATIPALSEIVALVDKRCTINIELKGKDTALSVVSYLKILVQETFWDFSDFIVSSFDKELLAQVRRASDEIKVGVLEEEKPERAIEIAIKLQAYSVHLPISCIKEEHVLSAHNNGLQVYVWTVNKKPLFEKMKSWNVDGIITDFPNFAT